MGWFPVDEVTLHYLDGRYRELQAQGIERIPRRRFDEWRARIRRVPMRTQFMPRASCWIWPRSRRTSPDRTRCRSMQSVAEIAKKKVAIQKAYLVSCVNSRLEDLEAAAQVLRGKKVAHGVKFYLAAASRSVQEEAEKRGIWQTLLDAGAHAASARMRTLHRPGHRAAGSG